MAGEEGCLAGGGVEAVGWGTWLCWANSAALGVSCLRAGRLLWKKTEVDEWMVHPSPGVLFYFLCRKVALGQSVIV